MEIASLIAGLGAVALYLLCFQLKEAKKLLACRFLSSILYVVQYLLLFAFVGAAMDASAAVRVEPCTPIIWRRALPPTA